MLVDQEENPNQSQSFEGERDLNVGKELQEVSQCNIYFKPMYDFSSVAIQNTY